MAYWDILLYPHPLLREKSTDIEEFTPELGQLIDDMFDTMFAAQGLGLAAPQIGKNIKLVVLDAGAEMKRGSELMELINPRIVYKSPETVILEEGCLSFPGIYANVERSAEIKVEAMDRHGKPFTIEADSFLAVALQHEIDHLSGILFIDHLGRVKQSMIKRKMKKITRGHKLLKREVRRRRA